MRTIWDLTLLGATIGASKMPASADGVPTAHDQLHSVRAMTAITARSVVARCEMVMLSVLVAPNMSCFFPVNKTDVLRRLGQLRDDHPVYCDLDPDGCRCWLGVSAREGG
jgi:hypothetical protein